MCRTNEISDDCGFIAKKGDEFSSKIVIKEIKCDTIPDFFEFFFENRKALLSNLPAESGYTDNLWQMLENHMNRDNFSGEYYAEMSKKWQCGWVGGGMSSFPLLQYGNEISKARAIQTIDFMTSHISGEGFFYTMIENGVVKDDGFENPHMKMQC